MARKNEYGKYILSAGEIGAYTVCPESWRLSNVKRVKSAHQKERIQAGNKLHQEWAQSYDDALYFKKHVRLVLLLLFVTLIIFLLLQSV